MPLRILIALFALLASGVAAKADPLRSRSPTPPTSLSEPEITPKPVRTSRSPLPAIPQTSPTTPCTTSTPSTRARRPFRSKTWALSHSTTRPSSSITRTSITRASPLQASPYRTAWSSSLQTMPPSVRTPAPPALVLSPEPPTAPPTMATILPADSLTSQASAPLPRSPLRWVQHLLPLPSPPVSRCSELASSALPLQFVAVCANPARPSH